MAIVAVFYYFLQLVLFKCQEESISRSGFATLIKTRVNEQLNAIEVINSTGKTKVKNEVEKLRSHGEKETQ